MFSPKAKIFIVEDEVIIADDLAGTLADLGHTVVGVADNVDDALIQISDKRPEVVLLDIHLNAETDGVDLGAKITTELNIPIIYVSAHIDKKTRFRAEATQPVSFITKPFDQAELSVAIKFAVGKRI